MTRNNLSDQQRGRKESLQGLRYRDLWYKSRRSNIQVTGVLKGEQTKAGAKKSLKFREIIAETCSNLMEKQKFTDSGSWANLKKDKLKENHAQTHHVLLQGIFPTQGSSASLTSPALAGGFFAASAAREALALLLLLSRFSRLRLCATP